MADLIKRIQSRLSSKGLSMTRPQIIAQLSVAVDDIQEADVSSIVEDLLNPSNSYRLSLVNQPSTSVQQSVTAIEPSETVQDTQTSSIVLTDTQKHQLVTSLSQQAGITLVGDEVKQVSRSIASQFNDRREMLLAITDAITAFTARIAEEEQEILDEFFSTAKGQLSTSNNNLKNTFNNLESEISQGNLDFKSVQTDILSLFAVS